VARPRRTFDEKTREALVRRQAALTALTKHPSWPEFKDEVKRKRDKLERQILVRMIPQARPTEPVDQAELFYLRGFIAGMEWFSSVPEEAESSLARFLGDRGIQTRGDDVDE
jgi:hypothetical protein